MITQNQQCRGRSCPALKETAQCGSPNNGCQHKCTNGVCSCNAGYNLSGSKHCIPKDCGNLTLTYCAPGTKLGTTCKHAIVSCPNNQTTYPVSCSVVCPSTYALKGVSSVACTTAGTWTSTSATYCRRINDPPTQIVLSGSHSVLENSPRNSLIGALTSVDPNPRDSHTYTLISGGEGKFAIIGDKLYTTVVLDYETMNKRYALTIRSTDNGNPSLFMEKVITITLNDVNERPSSIQLSSQQMAENSDIDTVVGVLSTTDQDTSQSHSYKLTDSASGRFRIDGKTLKVAINNSDCLQNGGEFCKFNYEQQRSLQITVRSTDNGSPALSINATLTITLTDVNDQPRKLHLSGNTVKENATRGERIGKFSAHDEDKGQNVSYYLSDNDHGRFAVSSDGYLTKVLATNYEHNKTHTVTAVVQDNGNPVKKMEKSFLIEVLDVNEPPVNVHFTDQGGQLSFSQDHAQVNESCAPDTVVGTLSATDVDQSQHLTFKLDINPLQSFSLTPAVCTHANNTICTAKVKVKGRLDHEVTPVLEISVRITDQHGLFIIQNFNITVRDNNDQPRNITISGGLGANVAENSPGAFIGELVTSDEDRNQSHSYNLLSNSNLFEVKRRRFLYLKNTPLDFEQKNRYVVVVTSTDNGSPPMTSVSQSFTVHVTDINEAPVLISLSNAIIPENSASGTIIGNITITDPDNFGNFSSRQAHICRLTDSAGGKFQILLKNGQNLLTQAVNLLNYEQAASHKILVLCTDPGGLSNETDFDVIVSDVNEAPLKVALSKTEISENNASAVVGYLTTQDPDNANNQSKQSFKYTLRSVGTTPFEISGNVLSSTRSLNYENARSWVVVVRAQDSGSPPLYRDERFVIDVVDENDRPSAIQLSNVQIKENSGVDTSVGNLATSDEDTGQNHTYRLMDSADGRFKIDGRVLKVAISNVLCLRRGGTSCLLNFEAQANYSITIRTTDNGIPAKSFDQTFTIYLNDENDRPRDLSLTNDVIFENATLGTMIGSFTARDEDRAQKLSFLLVNDDGGRLALNGDKLVTAKSLDHEADKRHVITVAVVDNGYNALKLERNFTIEVLNINEAPIAVNFTDAQSPEVFENTTTGSVLGSLLALDSDANQDLKFSLDDDSQGEFSLDPSGSACKSLPDDQNKTKCTTKLLLSKPLNYEMNTQRLISVRVTDTHGLFRVQKFTINVLDCNDAPTNILLGGSVTAVVRENSDGAFVGELRTIDEDRSQNWTYYLLDDFRLFKVVGKYIYINEGSHLDYEANSTYILTVKSLDNGVPAYGISRHFAIVVADVNEVPTKITLSNKEISENSSPGTVIANLTVDDPDNLVTRRQTHSCSVIGQNKLRIDSGRLVNSVALDFERTPFVNVSIECTDSGTPTLKYREDFTVIVKDENEAPSDIILSSFVVLENQNSGVIATISTIDPDNEFDNTRQNFSCRLVSVPSNDFPFKIEGHNLITTRALDHEAKSSWNITIQSRDNGKPSMDVNRSFVISVQDINEAPSNIFLSPNNMAENPEEGQLVGTLNASDEDFGQTHTFTLLDSASGRFKLINNSEIRTAISNTDCRKHGGKSCHFNYEAEKVLTIRVRAMDDGTPRLQKTMDINITLDDVNDQPRDLSLSKSWVDENVAVNTTVGVFAATDEDNDTLKYSLVEPGHGPFEVEDNGTLFVAKSVNHEESSTEHVKVKVADNGNPSKSMETWFTIVIKDVGDIPFNMSLTSSAGQQSYPDDHPKVNENSAIGTTVGTLVSLDQDAGDNLRFTLDDDAGGRFSINSTVDCHNETSDPNVKTVCSTKLLVNGSLDYEDVPSHEIIVEVSDGNHTIVSNFTVSLIDKNDSPQNVTIQGSLTGRVKENANDQLIGELVTSDQDASQSHVYSLNDARYAIKGSKLYTSSEANFNYEEQQEFRIMVTSTDSGKPQLSVQQNLTIVVEDVNEPPNNITLSSSSIQENSRQGTFVANITIDDPDNHGPKGVWQTHTCQLVDSAQNRFKIAGNSNTLLVSSGNLNYESSSSHIVIIQCSDSSSKPLSIQKSFQIQIVDVNERPQRITLSNAVVPENGGPLFVGELSTQDPDNAQSFNYSLVSASGENVFYIEGSQLKTNASLDYEERDLWDLKIISVDQGGLSTSQDFRITVTDTNDQPTDIFTSRPLAVSENSNLGSSIAVFTAVDEDAGQTHRFLITNISASGYGSSLAGYQTAFELDLTSGKLIVASDIDYETVTQFSLGIMTQDNGYPQFTFNKTFILYVLDINEPPSDLTLDNSQIAENSPKDSFVGNLSVKDPDNVNGDKQFYTCEVLNDVPFKVLQMQLLVAKAVLDFENRRDYSVKVNCTQTGNSAFYIYRSFPVEVTDVNEAPYDLLISNGTSVKENEPVNTPVGTLRASDQDSKDTITFEFADGSDDSSNFSINGSSLLTSASFNYEEKSSYLINVLAKDDGTPSLNETKQFEIKIIDRNDEPAKIGFSSSGVEENAVKGTRIGNFITDDQDKNDTHFYTLLDHTFTFYIDGDELKVKDSDRLDYEKQTKVVILVRTTDNGAPPLSIQANITVTILDSNDKPSAVNSNSTLSVDENTQGNTSILFEVRDSDVNQSHTCHVEDSEFFYISNTDGQSVLWVNRSAALDYEKNAKISIMVDCSDNGDPPLNIARTFDITINDVNEAPVDIFLNGSHEVDEIVYFNYSLGDLICIDPDQNQTCSFQVLGEYNDTFNVKTGENLLTVVSNAKLDYEKLDSPNISVTIEATDDGDPRLSLIKKLSITVDETNEGASDISLKPDNIVLKETSLAGTNISELTCNNPEKWQTLHYELLSYQNIFKIVKAPYNASFDPPILTTSGVKQGTFALYKSFLFLNETFPNYDISANYDILVGVTDNGEPPSSFNGTVFVNVSRVDPCLPVNNCSANATCSRIDGFVYGCECDDGFTGDGYNCTEIDDCLHSTYLNSTQNCDSGEENEVCTPCKNNATCIDEHLAYSCICLPGFNGTQCRQNIDECDPANFNYSCNEEHSTCKDGINNITCNCNRGFEDWLCNTNIDDCANRPCGDNGLCIDYTGSYQCNCREGYTGSRCERFVGRNEIQCQDDQIYVPFPWKKKEETGDPERGNTEVEENSASQDVCFSAKNVTTLYFDTKLIETLQKAGVRSVNDAVVSAMRIEIEDWLKKVIQVWYYYADSFTEEGMYNLSDVSVLDDIKVNANNISVSVIARVGHKALSRTGFLCSLSPSYPWKNCSDKLGYPEYTSKSFSFIDYLCPTAKDVEKPECKTRAAAAKAFAGNTGNKLPKWSIYLLGGVGAALFVFVLLFACYADRSQKSNLQQALRSGKQYDHVRLPEDDDESYHDAMLRHHVSTSASGEVNPVYGLDEDEEQAEMIPNPLYGMSRGIESPQIGHAKAFANPLYSTMEREPGLRAKPIGKDEDSSYDY